MFSTKKIIVGGLVALSLAFNGCLTDENKETGTSLNTALGFIFRRVSQVDTSGLTAFGLAWTQNVMVDTLLTADISKGTASKLVVLTPGDWTSITTREELKAKVDAATDVASYRGIHFNTPPNTFNEVIAVHVDTSYYILHITDSDDQLSTITPPDRIRTIGGQSKY